MSFKVLTINTYGGSLLLAAQRAEIPVVASLEDVGFGSDIQMWNFPKTPLFRTRAEWPETEFDWKEIIVLAHPPCAAFSNQNQNASARGTNADSFQCHINAMNYALGHKCVAMAIESVPGAFIAAKGLYEDYAKKYGYSCFFIFQNAASFGVPQWRSRFWVWFLKVPLLRIQHENPVYSVVADIIGKFEKRTPVDTLKAKSRTRPGLVRALSVADNSWKGGLLSILENRLSLPREKNFKNVREVFGLTGLFTTGLPRFLDPDDFATTVLEDSWWMVGKEELTVEEYSAVMGFPPNYIWGSQYRNFRKFLSKGICPPVGAWVIRQLLHNLLDSVPNEHGHYVRPSGISTLEVNRAKAIAERNRRACQPELSF